MRSQKGFSVLEAVLILVIISVIGGVAYFVYKQRPEPQETPYPYSFELAQAKNKDDVTELSSIFENEIGAWNRYENSAQGIYFVYPKNWTVHDSGLFKQPANGIIDDQMEYLHLGRILINSPEIANKTSPIFHDDGFTKGIQFEMIYSAHSEQTPKLPDKCTNPGNEIVTELKTEHILGCFGQNSSGSERLDAYSETQYIFILPRKTEDNDPTASRYFLSVYQDIARSLILR